MFFPLVLSACSGGVTTDQSTKRTGTEIAASVRSLDLVDREDVIFDEIARGNTPSWVGTFEPLIAVRDLDGVPRTVTIGVAADYLAVGTDEDPFLIPLTPQTAQRVAEEMNASLPTPLIVDLIWSRADVKLGPRPIPPSPQMTTVPVFEQHNETVQAQLRERQSGAGSIVAGHKKDVVLTNRLGQSLGRVAIYGWHQLNGAPIQPVYVGHTNEWVDYSHGIRLVHRNVDVDGVEYDLIDLLSDPTLAPLLSDEGVLTYTRYPTTER